MKKKKVGGQIWSPCRSSGGGAHPEFGLDDETNDTAHTEGMESFITDTGGPGDSRAGLSCEALQHLISKLIEKLNYIIKPVFFWCKENIDVT